MKRTIYEHAQYMRDLDWLNSLTIIDYNRTMKNNKNSDKFEINQNNIYFLYALRDCRYNTEFVNKKLTLEQARDIIWPNAYFKKVTK